MTAKQSRERAARKWARHIAEELGGVDHLTLRQTTLLEICCKSKAYLDELDAFLEAQTTVMDKLGKKGSVWKIFVKRQKAANALSAMINRLNQR